MAKIELIINNENQEVVELINKLNIDLNQDIKNFIINILKKGYELENINKNVIVEVEVTGDAEIKKLNSETRQKDSVTDVLSFPMYTIDELEDEECEIYKENKYEVILGSMVINVKRIHEQSIEYNTGIVRELAYMLVHSFYHLLQYDHMNESDKKIMRTKEEKLLTELGYEKRED